jgi:hypothetical protein
MQCPGCPLGGLDLSPSLFAFFASPDLGVLSGQWTFNGAMEDSVTKEPEAASTSTSSSPTPLSTHTHTRFHATSLASAEMAAHTLSVLDLENVEDTVDGDQGDELEVCDDDDDEE